ncbi:WDR76 protein, partial [Amia calva]|nr:WDR76 protein [Amia calva]
MNWLVYRTEKSLSSFDFLSENCATLVVGYWEGDVVLVDRRTPGTSHKSRSTLHSKTVRTVHMHPVNRQYFVAAGKGNVYIYDVRRLKPKGTEAVCSLPGHRSSVTSAYFSPSSGHRVVTTCSDHMIRVFDTSTCKGEAPLLNSIKHMNTGRWLTKLCAVWDPQQEDCFVVGSMERPRRMVVFHESGQMVHNFWDEQWLGSVCSVAAFHPSRNILVGANSSGRLHVFMN